MTFAMENVWFIYLCSGVLIHFHMVCSFNSIESGKFKTSLSESETQWIKILDYAITNDTIMVDTIYDGLSEELFKTYCISDCAIDDNCHAAQVIKQPQASSPICEKTSLKLTDAIVEKTNVSFAEIYAKDSNPCMSTLCINNHRCVRASVFQGMCVCQQTYRDPGLNVLYPDVYLPFDSDQCSVPYNSALIGPSTGQLGMALDVTAFSAWAHLGNWTGACWAVPRLCPNGITVALWQITMSNPIQNHGILSTVNWYQDWLPAQSQLAITGEGFAIVTIKAPLFNIDNKLRFVVSKPPAQVYIIDLDRPSTWTFSVMTWSEQDGLSVYQNGILVGQNKDGVDASAIGTIIADDNYNLVAGRYYGNRDAAYAPAKLDEVMISTRVHTAEDILKHYQSY